jgi:hypothetical protein
MRKYLLLLALLATSDAFAWSMDANVPGKPVCDRIDPTPAKSVIVPAHDAVAANTSAANPAVGAAKVGPTTPANSGGAAGSGHVRNTPRWQSFLPGMFK